jgi:hypothetical protein
MISMAWQRIKITYLRKGWTPKKIKEGIKKGLIKVRTKDVGRPKRHYIHMFYTKGGRLVAVTFGKFKRKKRI